MAVISTAKEAGQKDQLGTWQRAPALTVRHEGEQNNFWYGFDTPVRSYKSVPRQATAVRKAWGTTALQSPKKNS